MGLARESGLTTRPTRYWRRDKRTWTAVRPCSAGVSVFRPSGVTSGRWRLNGLMAVGFMGLALGATSVLRSSRLLGVGIVTVSLVSSVLVGREAESRSLSDALQRVLGGEPATVLVGGEAGVGKSRLVNELVGEARAAGARSLVGGCVELDGGGIPFAPLVDMFRALASELDADELEAIFGSARAEVGRLVPELDDGRVAAPGGERDPSRILELFLGVIGRLAGATPLVLVFEDVQWADSATLDLIALLVAGASGRRALLVFTVRSDELPRTHPFRRMAARWEQQRAVEHLELERLEGAGRCRAG